MLVGAKQRLAAVAGRRNAGFSIFQLVAAIAILGVLSAIAIPGFQGYLERARQTQALAELGEIEIAISEFSTSQAGQLPANLAAIGYAGAVDPWGNNWVYVNLTLGGSPRTDQSGVAVNTTYDLYSAGPDGSTALSLTAGQSEDDIIRASDGGFIGVVEHYTRLD
jgi:general secretion pathway protein G